MLCSFFYDFHILLITTYAFTLVPQIFLNLKRQVVSFDWLFNVFFVFPRLLIMLYFRLFSFNFMSLRPYPGFGAGALGLMLFSLGILFLQSRCGAFFFVPRFLMKKQFNYFFSKKDLKRHFARLKKIKLGEEDDGRKSDGGKGSRSRFSSFKSLMSSIGFGKKEKGDKKDEESKKEGGDFVEFQDINQSKDVESQVAVSNIEGRFFFWVCLHLILFFLL